jgi:hypothetical protein
MTNGRPHAVWTGWQSSVAIASYADIASIAGDTLAREGRFDAHSMP